MPALPSFMSYRPQLKGKVKSPFTSAKRRLEGGAASTSLANAPDVLDIGDNVRKDSMDFFDNGSPHFEHRPHGSIPSISGPSSRPQLELHLNPDSEQLSDWFSTNFPKPEPSPLQHGKPKTILEVHSDEEHDSDMLREEEVFEDSIEMMASGDVIANLEAMNASSFGRLHPENPSPPVRASPGRLTIPQNQHPQPSPTEGQGGSSGKSRPISQHSASPISSAVSGTTLARQLLGNGFSLSYDRRASVASRFRNPTGLTRSDSMTLPQGAYDDHFEVEPDAPPIPFNAESLYVPPRATREGDTRPSRVKTLRRRSSTGDITATPPTDPELSSFPPPSPISQRPSSVLVSPTEVKAAFRAFGGLPSPQPDAVLSPLPQIRSIPPAIKVSTVLTREVEVVQQEDASPPARGAASPEDVLDDYYSISQDGDTGEGGYVQRGFRPVFTPITEESLSQLSPPAPYVRNDRRDSQRHQPQGARSPATPRIRSMLSPKRSASESAASTPTLLTALEETVPPSTLFHSQSMMVNQSLQSNGAPLPLDTSLPLEPPPPRSKVFNRQRAGSAPSPILVDRDMDELSRYKIVAPTQSSGIPPTTANSSNLEQEFPTTAVAPWSAAFSPGIPQVEVLPEARMSALLPAMEPSGAEQILLTRSATSARVDGHSRQMSSLSNTVPADRIVKLSASTSSLNGGGPSTTIHGSISEEHPKVIPPKKPPPKRSLPPSPNNGPAPVPPGDEGAASIGALLVRSPSSATSVRSTNSSSSLSHGSQPSNRVAAKSLPPIPPPTISTSAPSPPVQVSPPVVAQATRGPRPRIPQPLSLREAPLPNVTAVNSSPQPEDAYHGESGPTPPVNAGPSGQHFGEQFESTHHTSLTPQTADFRKSTNTIDELLRASTSLGSPPPYYTVVDQLHAPPVPPLPRLEPTPSVAHTHTHQAAGTPAFQPSPNFGNPFATPPRDSTSSSRVRLARPAGPMGPRGPSMQGTSTFGITRDRSNSAASVHAPPPLPPQAPSFAVSPQRSQVRPPPETPGPVSPRFQAPAVRHRGYTMEAAKWTFSSSQLQRIVSKAIRESAQTSSIRLLKLESLEVEIPDEIHRLEMQRTEVQQKYKAYTKRRGTLFESLNFHLSSSSQSSDSTSVFRITEELASVSTTLDQLAEELHSTDVQLAQLNTLVQVHSSSALSMALRKLNASFLKQVSETQALQERVAALEAERDEAWKHAEDLASEYDHLSYPHTIDSPIPSSSNRSSRVSAKRKSSIRASKAGLRSRRQSRQSARSSVASNYFGPLSSATSPRGYRAEKVPPLPPIPKRRPADIITDYQPPLPSSSGPLSMDDATPNSEARALNQAEEELYSMLGLRAPDPLRRSHSMVGHLPSAGLSPPPVLSPPVGASLFRRSSLPGGATLVEAQNAMTADRNAVVFTFEMLQDDSDSESGQQSSRLPYTGY